MKTAGEILKEYWGYETFRPLQEDIIKSALEGRDTLALLPTGGGKSICFQVPGMIKDGVTLVISPLIALMKDQVENLNKKGIKSVAIYSGMSFDEIDTAFDNVIYGDYKFLYLSPERLRTELAKLRLARLNINYLVVDEAHCISQWGYDFRPSYLKIAEIREFLPDVPVLALTATATPDVVAVTATDTTNHVYRYAGRGPHIRFAAQGVAVPATTAAGQLALHSGTSFAAPHVSATLALCVERVGRRAAAACVTALERLAVDLGDAGRDPVYGFGLVR